jgi:ATPase subunit of ABC transporter with duplicated ATPase domains
MKILGGELEPSAGETVLQAGMRLGKLNQNQFAYEDERVLDVVMQGHAEMWQAMQQRDRIYADPNATDDDYMRAAELEGKFAEYGGYTAEARAGSILSMQASRARHSADAWFHQAEATRAARAGIVLPPTCCCSTSRRATWTSTRSAGSSVPQHLRRHHRYHRPTGA